MRDSAARRQKSEWRQTIAAGVAIAGCVIGIVVSSSYRYYKQQDGQRVGRELEESSNATHADDGCPHLESWEINGGIAAYIVGLVYIFVALAIVCDDYFVSALEKITEALKLSQDVAGATFMAAGSSAPELFVSLADNVFREPKESLGVGTIIGSAIFNILIIIALTALLAGQVLELDWRPMVRDSLWYIVAIIALIVTTHDGDGDVYESAVLFVLYILYTLYMAVNERVISLFCPRPSDAAHTTPESGGMQAENNVESTTNWESIPELAAADIDSKDRAQRHWGLAIAHAQASARSQLEAQNPQTSATRQSWSKLMSDLVEQGYLAQNPIHSARHRVFRTPVRKNTTGVSSEIMSQGTVDGAATLGEESQVEGGYFSELTKVPASIPGKIWFIFTLPINIAFRLTIPDCRYPRFSGPVGYSSSFILSIVWIAILSHFTVKWATMFGCIAGIPSALMGLTIIAAGTSIPDALSSVLVARAGHGNMAVSNAIGSNVFDILLGLGLPFFLSNLIYDKSVVIDSKDLLTSIIILFSVLIFVLLVLLVGKWKLYPWSGGILIFLYVLYVIYSYLNGLGML